MGVAAAGATVEIASVNVGRPRPLGLHRGRLVRSAIYKQPVSAAELALGEINLAGDDQGDRSVHGGPDKALYAYPLAHLRAWAAELAPQDPGLFVPGALGDNLTVEGWTEDSVRIGDIWAWGEALIQVAQPRSPCYKLALRTGIPQMTRLFEETGRCGWYLRVLRTGTVPTRPPLRLRVVERDERGLSVTRAQQLRRGGTPQEIEAAMEHPALAAGWRASLDRRRAVVDGAAR